MTPVAEGRERALTLILTQFLSTKDYGQVIEDIKEIYENRETWLEIGDLNGWF